MKFLITGGAGFIGSAVIRNIINNADSNHFVWKELEEIWNKEYVPTSKYFTDRNLIKASVHEWEMVKPCIKPAVERMIVNQVNGNSGNNGSSVTGSSEAGGGGSNSSSRGRSSSRRPTA